MSVWTSNRLLQSISRSEVQQNSGVLTDELQGEVFVGARLFGVFVQKHDGPSDPAVLQGLLTHAGQLQEEM